MLLGGELFVAGIEREQEVVGVPHDRRAIEVAQKFEALDGLRAALGVVAQAYEVVDLELAEVFEHGA